MGKYFGTDGFRGEANKTLTFEHAIKIGRFLGWYYGANQGKKAKIVIGKDTRRSSYMFEYALASGITASGGDAYIMHVTTTPSVSYISRTENFDCGIMISASHNAFHDNGIKFFGGDGYKLPDAVEDELEKIVRTIENGDALYRANGSEIGTLEYHHELLNDYIDFVAGTTEERFDGVKVVLDCANGAAYEAMPAVLRRLGAELIVMNDAPDGSNINSGCGSTHLEALQKRVVEEKADFGIAHDGDADRCLCVDEKGQVIDGDHILMMCALEMMKKGTLKDNTVVTTVMANIGFHKAVKEAGGRTEVTKVGDRYVLENMLANGYKLGGEQSGHIIFSDFSTTGDGLITGLQVLSSVKRSGKKASELSGLMTSYPQLLVNVRVKTKEGWEQNAAIAEAIKKGNEELGSEGRILVRPSGTEPLIRVMAEGQDTKQLEVICNSIAEVVAREQQ